MNALLNIRRWLWLLLLLSIALYVSSQAFQRSKWYKDWIYARLLSGTDTQQLRAASTLAYLGAEEQLLRALQSDKPTARDLGQRALEYLWFRAAGEEAYQSLEKAFTLAEKKQLPQALETLHQLIQKHPQYAEGWNRRASVYWQMGKYENCRADSERALALNPCHYGAWQGLGMCYLKMGKISEASKCLHKALKIIPFDPITRQALKQCEELLRIFPPLKRENRPLDLVESPLPA